MAAKLSAVQLKDRGNAAFSVKDYALAESLYSDALNIDPNMHILYSNR